MRLFTATLVLSCLTTAALPAQVTYEGCRDIRGIPVASVLDFSVADVAMAGQAPNGSPVIRYNPNVLSWYAPQTRLWWYGHECGHHALGHSFGTTHPLAVEQAADCFGITELRRAGRLRASDLRIIQADLSRTGPGDWTHLPGPIRAVNLERCLDTERRRSCNHPRHRSGDISPCRHYPAHPAGDVVRCQHRCATPWGPGPCHPRGDIVRCSHPQHPQGDVSPCTHSLHPQGH